MENETEVTREQMEETRTALTEKLEALEEQVASTVQVATAAVEETVQAVTDTVHKASESVENTIDKVSETVGSTVDKVKESLDLSQHVQSHPWAMMGGAVAVGFLAGRFLPSASRVAAAVSSAATNGHATPSSVASSPSHFSSSPCASADGRSDWLAGLTKTFGPMVKELEGLAIGALTTAVGEMVLKSTPEEYRPHVKEVIDHFTTSLGGTVIKHQERPS